MPDDASVISNPVHVRDADTSTAVPRQDGLCVRAAYVRAVREESREVDFVCSNDTVDSYGERVLPNWNLKRFERNPVALFAHDSRSLPIGKWLNMRVDGPDLVGTLKVGSDKSNPLCANIWECLKEKTLNAVSVGFIPHSVRWEKENDVDTLYLDDNELMECSVVPIPANPDCLARLRERATAEAHAKVASPHQKTTAPTRAHKEPTMATDEKTTKDGACPACSAATKDAETHRVKAVEFELAAKTAEDRVKAAESDRDAKVAESAAKLAAETAARDASDKALAAANEKILGMQVESDILPFLGTKLAPAEKDGLVEFGRWCLAKGEAGVAQWKTHIDGIKSRADIPQSTGGSKLPAEPNDGGVSRNADTDSGSELVAIANKRLAAANAAPNATH